MRYLTVISEITLNTYCCMILDINDWICAYERYMVRYMVPVMFETGAVSAPWLFWENRGVFWHNGK